MEKPKEVDLETKIAMLEEQLAVNQMPPCGNLGSSKRKEVKQRIKCISALLRAREKTFKTREMFEEKIRRLEMDKEI